MLCHKKQLNFPSQVVLRNKPRRVSGNSELRHRPFLDDRQGNANPKKKSTNPKYLGKQTAKTVNLTFRTP